MYNFSLQNNYYTKLLLSASLVHNVTPVFNDVQKSTLCDDVSLDSNEEIIVVYI